MQGHPTVRAGNNIGIVGGGASAVALLEALAEAARPPARITVFEPSSRLWRGRPYQPDMTSVRVNIPPEGMSLRFGDRGHFSRWLADQDTTTYADARCGTMFVPRALYGRYLEHSAEAAIDRLTERGWRVSVIRDAVRAAVPIDDGLLLHTATGIRVPARHVVLSVGRAPSADAYQLAGTPGFVSNPYPMARHLPDIDPDSHVAVLGTGLTGVDAALSLAAAGHRGRIMLASRSGVLPAVRQRVAGYTLRHFTASALRSMADAGRRLTLADVIRLMHTELADAGQDIGALLREIAAVETEDPVHRLRRQFDAVDSPDLGMRILQAAVPAAGPDVWPLLSDTDKQTVLQRHYRAVMTFCCPMPPSSAARLLKMVDAGQLTVLSDVHDVRRTGPGFTISAGDRRHVVASVINAVNGPVRRISTPARALIDSLIRSGLAEYHPLGGLRLERSTSRLTVGGRPDSRLHAIGDLAAGSLFFTFGMPSIVDRAYDIAADILDGAWEVPRPTMPHVLELV